MSHALFESRYTLCVNRAPVGRCDHVDSESTSRLREEIARTLRDAIARQGLTQAAAAEKLGISRDSLHRIVAGKTMPTAELLARCAKQWGLSLSVMGPNFRHPSEDSEKTARQSEVYPLAGAKPNQLGVFLCHASEDKPMVRKLYERLYEDAFLPWLDSEDLLPGQDWDYEIRNAVRASDAVLVCLSGHATQKSGYVQKEIAHALDAAEEKPEATIFIIPVLLEPCTIPTRLRKWQWVDLGTEKGYEKLLLALKSRAKQLGLTITPTSTR